MPDVTTVDEVPVQRGKPIFRHWDSMNT
jgi:hypothetical protein